MIIRSCLLLATAALAAANNDGAGPSATTDAAPPGLSPFPTGTRPYAQGVPTGQAIRGDYGGALRPQVHLSPPVGYLSDPNGLFKDDGGTWHVYYQYNPTNPVPGPGNWGHATSPDLYHWTNAPIALHPPERGVGVGNGSVVHDTNNTSGLGSVVAVYTINGTVALAGSEDGGYAFTPAGSVGVRGRDPRVARLGGEWVLAIARGDKVAFYTSSDLKTWRWASDFVAGGRVSAPSLAEVAVEGGGTAHVLFLTTTDAPLGGEAQVYFTGAFADGVFAPDGPAAPAEWGKDASGGVFDPTGAVAISWANNVQYAARVPTASESWRGALTLPRAVSVKVDNGRRVLALGAYGLDGVRGPEIASAGGDSPQWRWDAALDGAGAFLLELKVGAGTTLNCTFSSAGAAQGSGLGGGELASPASSVSGGLADGQLYIDRGGTASGFNSTSFTPRLSTPWHSGETTLRIVLDRSVLEVFADDKCAATAVFYPAAPLTRVAVHAEGKVEAKVYDLGSGWEGDGTGGGGSVRQRRRRRALA
ncbi:Invertase [Vanrija albida]|uniref:Invertase n=1 Tax=Vanrija albida TaxID=181172 RepID=A0ABR3PVA0_9TREE